jgi:hypothetical protein
LGLKILKIHFQSIQCWDPDLGSGIEKSGSGMEKSGSGREKIQIRGSAILVTIFDTASICIQNLNGHEKGADPQIYFCQ